MPSIDVVKLNPATMVEVDRSKLMTDPATVVKAKWRGDHPEDLEPAELDGNLASSCGGSQGSHIDARSPF